MSTNRCQFESLKQLIAVYKLDFRRFLTDDLNETNFVEYQPLVVDIYEWLENDDDGVHQSRALLESTSEKLLDYCLKHMFNKEKNNIEQLKKNENNYWSLKYMRICLPYACNNACRLLVMLNAYAYHFVAINGSGLEKKLKLPDAVERLLASNASNDQSYGDSNAFELRTVNYLSNYFSVTIKAFEPLLKEHLNSINEAQTDVVNKQTKEIVSMVRFLVEFALLVLYDMGDDEVPGLSQLCIDCLTRLASITPKSRDFILRECFETRLKRINADDEASKEELEHGGGVSEKKRLETFVQDKSLCLLVALADLVMNEYNSVSFSNADETTNSKNKSVDYLRKRAFWLHIQSGLANTNSLTRKRALYLLKRAADLSISSDSEDSYHLKRTKLSEGDISGECENVVLLYDPAPIAVWNDFFLCIELLEETSVHIIKPSLIKFFSLIEAINNGQLHFSWLLVLLKRAFIHESKFVVRWTLNAFLECEIHSLFNSIEKINPYNDNEVLNMV
jgi:hypothetical protein